jgi:hypothetical protein
MQISFLTFFLGLVAGAHPVAVSAGPGVAAVELRLDNGVVARLRAPSWSGQVDLGAALLPHHLEAVALDAKGAEVGLAEQWLNVPGPSAAVDILLDPAPAGQPRRVRLAWRSITRDAPRAVKLTLDGKPLKLDGHYQAELPPRPADSPTAVLSAELRFSDGLVARRDLALGRDYDDSVTTELTGVPVWVRGGAALPPAAGLQDWFRDVSGQAVLVDAVDAGAPQLIVVRDPQVERTLRPYTGILRAKQGRMAAGGALSFLWPASRGDGGAETKPELFGGSGPLEASSLSIPFLLASTRHADRPPLRFADAVAVAGLQASAIAAPRAVLLALTPGAHDESRFTGPLVRRYLAAIRVPLLVWSVGSPDAAMGAAWGAAEDVTNWDGLGRASHQLTAALATQRIVWLSGRHLPQRLALTPGVTAVQLDPPPVP